MSEEGTAAASAAAASFPDSLWLPSTDLHTQGSRWNRQPSPEPTDRQQPPYVTDYLYVSGRFERGNLKFELKGVTM